MKRQIFGTVPRLPVPRLTLGGSLGTPKILSTGAQLHLGPIRLHVENWECRAVPIFLARVNGVLSLICLRKQKTFSPVLSINSSQKDDALPVKTSKPNFVSYFVYFGNSLLG